MSINPIEKAISSAGSVKQFAKSLNVSLMAVSNWRNGKRLVSPHKAKEIHKLYGIPLHELRNDLWDFNS